MSSTGHKTVKIVVLGAGINGLSSAVAIQEFFKSTEPSTPFDPSKPKEQKAPEGCGQFNLNQYVHESFALMHPEVCATKSGDVRVQVTVMAESFPPHTTGEVSAGIWSPSYIPEDQPKRIEYALLVLDSISF